LKITTAVFYGGFLVRLRKNKEEKALFSIKGGVEQIITKIAQRVHGLHFV
jgi:hypothetical protein